MGLFIANEGGDGSGKGTQTRLLVERLENEGFQVATESYPRYEEPVAELVKRFLDGKYGQPHPELISLPYAVDRMLGSAAIRSAIASPNGVFISDRYSASNLGHNGSKFDSAEERLEYFEFWRNYEHNILGVPKPDHNFIFQIPVEVAQANIDKKEARNYTDKKRDIHEADANHLQRTFDTYGLLAQTYPDEYTIIDPMADLETMRPIEEIHEELYAAVRRLMN